MTAHTILREGMEVLCRHCDGWHVLARNPADAQRKTAESDFLYFTDHGRIYYRRYRGDAVDPSRA